MEQLKLPMLTYYSGPRLIDAQLVIACRTYREACKACWDMRTRRHMTRAFLAQSAGLYASHVSDYFSDDEAKRELPAKHVNAVEIECGNRFISQWLAHQANLTILEQFLPKQLAAAA